MNSAAKCRHLVVLFQALNIYEKIALANGNSTRILFQKAEIYVLISQLTKSETMFEQAIDSFNDILRLKDVTETHVLKASQRSVTFFGGKKVL